MSVSLISFVSASAATSNKLTSFCSLNLRSSPSVSSSVITTLPAKADLTLLSNSTNGWAKVSYSTYTGYCSTAYVYPQTGSKIVMTGVTSADLNLRSGKGTSFSVVTVIPNKAKVTVTNNADEDWAYVTYSGKKGYVSKSYLTVMFTLPSATPATTPAPTENKDNSFEYRNPSYNGVPKWFEYSYTDSIVGSDQNIIEKLVLSKSNLYLKPNETYKLLSFVSDNSVPVMNRVSYSSSNTSVATVSSSGVVTAKASGTAKITATDSVSKKSATCLVSVTSSQTPTEAVTQAPTQKPTVAPTKPPTQRPIVAPTQPPVQKPTTSVKETLSLSTTKVTMYYNNHFQIIATSNTSVSWSTSDSSVATVSNGFVISKGIGTATITARTATKSATCTVKVISATTSIEVSHRAATVSAGKTFLAYSSVSSAEWSSSNPNVATVNNGYILGVSAGKAVITASTNGGNRTIIVTVLPAEPIRFTYTSPNCATKNSAVTLVAITDNKRTAVKFEVVVNNKIQTVNATSKSADGKNYIWKGTISFNTAGTYNVTAYSKYNNVWSTCDDASTTAFVTSTTDKTTTVCSKRRASDEIIDLIACYEGFISSIYADPLTGDPTVGYGRVIYSGQTFYNSLSKNEAYAYLVQTVNNDGYATKVNSFLVNNSIKFNQQQFDALVCFVYNTGTGVLSYDSELISALKNCSSGTSGTTTYYINGSAVRIRKGPGTSYGIIDELDYGTTLKILQKTNAQWYYVQLNDGTKGYVCTDYIAEKVSSGGLDLNFVKKQNLINKFCQYHHANGCIRGLLYRRVDEMEVFFYNDYERNYGVYNYPISFTCANNSSFHT